MSWLSGNPVAEIKPGATYVLRLEAGWSDDQIDQIHAAWREKAPDSKLLIMAGEGEIESADEMAERLAFAVEDYLVRMHGIVSSQRAAEFAPAMLRYALGLVPEGEDWMSTENADRPDGAFRQAKER